MTEGGFFERKSGSPTGLVLVVAMHTAALGALALMKGPEIQRRLFPPTVTTFIPAPQDPPPVAQPQPEPRQPTMVASVPPVIDTPVRRSEITQVDRPPLPTFDPSPPRPLPEPRVEPQPQPRTPVRVAAQIDPRYAAALQPPYPGSEQRAQRGGSVRVRVAIGADGRVKAIERLSATSDAFWEATERHALARWRFRPATEDGRPVESVKVMTLVFRIEDA